MSATADDIMKKLELLDKIEDSLRDVKNNYKLIKEKYLNLETIVNDLSIENKNLTLKLETINSELDRSKQNSIKTNLEISGIPVTENEDLVEISTAIFSHLGITEEKSIKYAYRKRSRRNKAEPPPIIVSTDNKGIRDRVLKNKRKRTLDTTILNNLQQTQDRISDCTVIRSSQKRLIYINEHLTDFNKYILKRAKDLRRSGKIFGTWVRNGFVIIKKEANSTEQTLTKISQIEELEFDGGNRFNISVQANIM